MDYIQNFTNIYSFSEYSFQYSDIFTNGDLSNPQTINLYIDSEDPPYHDLHCNGIDTCNIYCFEPSLLCAENMRWYGCKSLPDIYNHSWYEIGNATCNIMQYIWIPTETPTVMPTVEPTINPTDPTNKPTVDPTTPPTQQPIDTTTTTSISTSFSTTVTTTERLSTNNPTSSPIVEVSISSDFDVSFYLTIEGTFSFGDADTTDEKMEIAQVCLFLFYIFYIFSLILE